MPKRKTEDISTMTDPQQIAREARKRGLKESSIASNPEDNRKYVYHTLRLAQLGKVEMRDPEAVQNRVYDYFEVCAEEGLKPSLPGLAIAFGLSKSYLQQIAYAAIHEDHPARPIIRLAMEMLDAQMVDYMTDGKINPVSGIFLMKNHFSYSDRTEVTVTADTVSDAASEDELKQKYIDSVFTEVPENTQESADAADADDGAPD